MTGPRYAEVNGMDACLDCGVYVCDRTAHTRSHSIMSSWAWTLAILKTHHASAEIHGKYSIIERIDSKKFDNWSSDALAQVVAELEASDADRH